jgi:hypothetical protein
MTTMVVDLRAEAAAEVQRVLRARTFTREGDEGAVAQLEAHGPWITPARRPALRRLVGRRLILIWRVAYEDACGGRAETRLVPVVIELSAARHTWITARLREVDSDVRGLIDAEGREWRETVERLVGSVASVRIARERAIAAWLARTDRTAFQPGLFDRRAERAQRVHATATAESERITADRIASSERVAVVVLQPAQLLLVLAP